MIALIRKVFHLMEHRGQTRTKRMELRKHLRKAREDAMLSVNEISKRLNVGRAQIWRMESKDADFISVGRLRKLADHYGRPVNYFFNDNQEITETEISYQLIGMAVAATETVAIKMPVRPSPEALKAATIAVIRTQQKRWSDDPKRRFNPEEFVVLIEQHLEASN